MKQMARADVNLATLVLCLTPKWAIGLIESHEPKISYGDRDDR